MKQTFTVKEVEEILLKALEDTLYDESEAKNEIALTLDKAWNRGSRAMYNHSLIKLYGFDREVSA